jgi:hypothetical protein
MLANIICSLMHISYKEYKYFRESVFLEIQQWLISELSSRVQVNAAKLVSYQFFWNHENKKST